LRGALIWIQRVIGQPKVLAEALRKIAFGGLFPLKKRESAFRSYWRAEWLRFEPPSAGILRVSQLEKVGDPQRMRHTFLTSTRNSLKDFVQA
jgi:hypothetical protein